MELLRNMCKQYVEWATRQSDRARICLLDSWLVRSITRSINMLNFGCPVLLLIGNFPVCCNGHCVHAIDM